MAATAEVGAPRTPNIASVRALVVDLAYRPLYATSWQRALTMALIDKCDVVETYDENLVVRSSSDEYLLPAVIRVRTVFKDGKQRRRVSLNRKNVFLRDKCRCVYCGSGHQLTVDHVIPKSRGGKDSWENLVTACAACNNMKGDQLLADLGWHLVKQPKEPSAFLYTGILGSLTQQTNNRVPAEWHEYLHHYHGLLGSD